MAFSIQDSCISCGACAAECPVDAISQGDTQFEINADVVTVQMFVQLVHQFKNSVGERYLRRYLFYFI